MILYDFGLLTTYTISICTHTFSNKHILKLLFHNAYFIICFTCTWNILFYASARCKTSSRLQCTALSQHSKQAHMCLYYSALAVCHAEAVQIGAVPMLSEKPLLSPFSPPTHLELILLLLHSVPQSNTDRGT